MNNLKKIKYTKYSNSRSTKYIVTELVELVEKKSFSLELSRENILESFYGEFKKFHSSFKYDVIELTLTKEDVIFFKEKKIAYFQKKEKEEKEKKEKEQALIDSKLLLIRNYEEDLFLFKKQIIGKNKFFFLKKILEYNHLVDMNQSFSEMEIEMEIELTSFLQRKKYVKKFFKEEFKRRFYNCYDEVFNITEKEDRYTVISCKVCYNYLLLELKRRYGGFSLITITKEFLENI